MSLPFTSSFSVKPVSEQVLLCFQSQQPTRSQGCTHRQWGHVLQTSPAQAWSLEKQAGPRIWLSGEPRRAVKQQHHRAGTAGRARPRGKPTAHGNSKWEANCFLLYSFIPESVQLEYKNIPWWKQNREGQEMHAKWKTFAYSTERSLQRQSSETPQAWKPGPCFSFTETSLEQIHNLPPRDS